MAGFENLEQLLQELHSLTESSSPIRSLTSAKLTTDIVSICSDASTHEAIGMLYLNSVSLCSMLYSFPNSTHRFS